MRGERLDVLVRRDSEFGLLRDIEKRTQVLGRSLEGCRGPAPCLPTVSGEGPFFWLHVLLQQHYLRSMVETGELVMRFANELNHAQQAYMTCSGQFK